MQVMCELFDAVLWLGDYLRISFTNESLKKACALVSKQMGATEWRAESFKRREICNHLEWCLDNRYGGQGFVRSTCVF